MASTKPTDPTITTTTTATIRPKPEPQSEPPTQPTKTLSTELQLVSSLAQLQSLESKIHHLRTLLPSRLLAPLSPIVEPRKGGGAAKELPSSPQALWEQLTQTMRAGADEVKDFQTLWTSPEMKTVWEHVEADIAEMGGQLLQPTGVWGVDYPGLLEEILRREKGKEEDSKREEEEKEKEKWKSSGADWRGLVEEFGKKGVPGVKVVLSQQKQQQQQHEKDGVIVALVKAGMVILVNPVPVDSGGEDLPEWRVSSKISPGRPITKLETAMVECLNSRVRKWDLAYLLDMISSYSDIKTTPCKKCNKMTDDAAQLPYLRVPKSEVSPDGQRTSTFEPFHSRCV